ncbi:MAG: hypothetical protein AB7E12_00865 [Burkholderiaceae bacterium]
MTRALRSFGLAALVALSGCTTTGSSFDSSALPALVPGQTTMAQASALLKSDPVQVYRRLDGSATAIWAHKASWVPDAVYFNQELWLAFGPDGTYQRIVKGTNIPRANQFGSHNPP